MSICGNYKIKNMKYTKEKLITILAIDLAIDILNKFQVRKYQIHKKNLNKTKLFK